MLEHDLEQGRPETVDPATVRNLRAQVADRLSARESARRDAGEVPLDDEDRVQLGRHLIYEAITGLVSSESEAGRAIPSLESVDALSAAVEAAMFGAGPLQPLLDDDDVENIDINGCDLVFVSYADGTEVEADPIADSDDELISLIQVLGAHSSLNPRPFDPANPQLDVRLHDGSRLSATRDICRRPAVSIRRHRLGSSSRLDELVQGQTLSPELARFLVAAVRGRLNVMIAGATNSGKTTLLRTLAHECDPGERLVTVERALELGLGDDRQLHRNVLEYEERLPNAEGQGAVSLAELVRRTLRMNPGRVIVGEVLGDEVVTMLNAMSQGNDGSLSTIHASSALEAVTTRISAYAIQAAERLPEGATGRLVAGAIDLVVFLRKDGDFRAVREVREVTGYSSDRGGLVTTPVFEEDPVTGTAVRTEYQLTEEHQRRLDEGGWQR